MLYIFSGYRCNVDIDPVPGGSNTAGMYMSRMQHGVTTVKTMGYIEPDPGGPIYGFPNLAYRAPEHESSLESQTLSVSMEEKETNFPKEMIA